VFGMPWKSTISLCKKSRMKNEADSRTLPNSSRLLTETPSRTAVVRARVPSRLLACAGRRHCAGPFHRLLGWRNGEKDSPAEGAGFEPSVPLEVLTVGIVPCRLRGPFHASLPKTKFAADSALEEDGFEPPVPLGSNTSVSAGFVRLEGWKRPAQCASASKGDPPRACIKRSVSLFRNFLLMCELLHIRAAQSNLISL
jgi:hypothetical protein